MNIWVQLIIGIVYANLGEYVMHRWALHPHHGTSPSHRFHHMHPDVTGSFVKADVWVIFAVHVAVLYTFHLLPLAITIGLYLVTLELTHRAQHRWNFGYHLWHHEYADCRYNVFLPLGDLIFGTWRKR